MRSLRWHRLNVTLFWCKECCYGGCAWWELVHQPNEWMQVCSTGRCWELGNCLCDGWVNSISFRGEVETAWDEVKGQEILAVSYKERCSNEMLAMSCSQKWHFIHITWYAVPASMHSAKCYSANFKDTEFTLTCTSQFKISVLSKVFKLFHTAAMETVVVIAPSPSQSFLTVTTQVDHFNLWLSKVFKLFHTAAMESVVVITPSPSKSVLTVTTQVDMKMAIFLPTMWT